MSKMFQPSATFHVSELSRSIIVIDQVEKIIPFVVQYLKYHLPIL